ncbi:RcnB family protein [Flavisphingomonas formosensis]|uniref:RcnB family protein n=1 Tax=Flavisphingomonas formosensis TaxID=861534 RepID=UPI0012FB86CC|nr:RcnB family protein [Sphingomonas formosensis]
MRPPQPGRPEVRPPQPGRPEVRPPKPGRPEIQPPQPGRPGGGNGVRPPHRPGQGRPPNFRPIQRPPFHYPHGYRYRRWSIGLLLPRIFLSTAYYFGDWNSLGVGAPPRGYRWVRYGPDLLLVRTRDRRIVDVIYGAFY